MKTWSEFHARRLKEHTLESEQLNPLIKIRLLFGVKAVEVIKNSPIVHVHPETNGK